MNSARSVKSLTCWVGLVMLFELLIELFSKILLVNVESTNNVWNSSSVCIKIVTRDHMNYGNCGEWCPLNCR